MQSDNKLKIAIPEEAKAEINGMRSGSITPRIKAETQKISVPYAKLKKLYESWEKITITEITQISTTYDAIIQNGATIWSQDLQKLSENNKSFEELTKETSGKAIRLLEAIKKENETQLNLVQKLLSNWSFLKQKQDDESENFVFEDYYFVPNKNDSNGNALKVKRYGINFNSNLCVEEYNSLIGTFLGATESNTELLEASSSRVSSSTSRKSNNKKTLTSAIEHKLLHPVEVFTINQAINTLKEPASSCVVLCDIFESKKDCTINVQEYGTPKTHTIVLYRKSDKEIELIDPSNSEFSAHLVSDYNKRFFDPNIIIVVSEKTKKLYIPGDRGNVGPNYNQFRDCIDIAVKVAFVLSDLSDVSKKQLLDGVSAYDVLEVKTLSNQPEFDPIFPPSNAQSSLRVKQSSLSAERNECHKTLFSINDALTKTRKLFSYRVDIEWNETQDINDHPTSLVWLRQKEQSLVDFIKEQEEQNKKTTDSLRDRGLKFYVG